MSSDDSGLSTGAEDGGKSEAASEEDEAQSEGAESDGAESEGDNARRKEQVTKQSSDFIDSFTHTIYQRLFSRAGSMSRATLSSHYGVRMLGCLLDLYVSKLRWTPENNNEEVFLLSSIIFFPDLLFEHSLL